MLNVRDLRGPHFGPLDFELEPGGLLFLAGPSGSGKSQALRALADLDPHDGEILLAGEAQAAVPAPAWRRRVGYLPARPAWWGERVGEHFGPDVPFAALGLEPDILDRAPETISSGEGQRLGLLRLLAAEPCLLLLDEPCANLDPEATAAVEGLVARHRADGGCGVVWVTHDGEQRERLGGPVVELRKAGRG